MKSPNFILGGVLTLLCLFGCSSDRLAGSGSESSNAFTGNVYGPTGVNSLAPVAGADVILYRIEPTDSGYQWAVYLSTTSDVQGQFTIDSLSYGRYSILVQKDGLKDFAYFDYTLRHGSILVDSVILRPTQNITGTLKDSSGVLINSASLGLVGTPFFDTTGIDGKFVFDSVPAGIIYSFQILASQSVLFSWSRSALAVTAINPLFSNVSSRVASDSAGGCDVPEFGFTDPVETDLLTQDTVFTVNSLCGWQTDTLSVKLNGPANTTTIIDGNYLIEYSVTPNP